MITTRFEVLEKDDNYYVKKHVTYSQSNRLKELFKSLIFLAVAILTGNPKGFSISKRAWKQFRLVETHSEALLTKDFRVINGQLTVSDQSAVINWINQRLKPDPKPADRPLTVIPTSKPIKKIIKVSRDAEYENIKYEAFFKSLPEVLIHAALKFLDAPDRYNCLLVSKKINQHIRSIAGKDIKMLGDRLTAIIQLTDLDPDQTVRKVLAIHSIRVTPLDLRRRERRIVKEAYKVLCPLGNKGPPLDNRDILLYFAKYIPTILAMASNPLKIDPKFVLEMVQLNPRVYSSVSKDLRENNVEIATEAVKRDLDNYAHVPKKLKGDKPFILDIMPYLHWTDLNFPENNLNDDEEVILKAISIDPMAFQFASEELRGKAKIALAALVWKRYIVLQHATAFLKNSVPFMVAAIEQTRSLNVLTYALAGVTHNPYFIRVELPKLFVKFGFVHKDLPNSILENEYFMTQMRGAVTGFGLFD